MAKDSVELVEVGPRDGLQNEKTIISSIEKIEFIKSLVDSGYTRIEVASFVKADKIPQMADAIEVYKGIKSISGCDLMALVPNLQGLDNALSVGVKNVAVFTATSETFNKKNIDASIDESMEKIAAVFEQAIKNNIKIRGYVSTVFGCPYEGETSLDKAIELSQRLFDLGAYEVSLGDTTGVANPFQVETLIEKWKKVLPIEKCALHFHDTRGLALANTFAGFKAGVRVFDCSAAGLGGCPYAKGATGNVASEDMVYLFESLGVETGIDRKKLAQASEKILKSLGKMNLSKNASL